MYIGENIQKRSNLGFDIEDFDGARGRNRVTKFLPIIASVLFFLANLLSLLIIPVMIILVGLAIIAIMEFLDKPVISKFFRFGISQNVVSKFVPAYSAENRSSQRKRKVVLVSHYDSGRTFPGGSVNFCKVSTIIDLTSAIIMSLMPIMLLIKLVAFSGSNGGGASIFFVVFSFVFILISLVPLIFNFYKNKQNYNDSANFNASGSATLIEIARQLGLGSYSEFGNGEEQYIEPVIHGLDNAKENQAVDDDTNVKYEAAINDGASGKIAHHDPLVARENELSDAKAAVAAFTAPRKKRAKYDDDGNIISDEPNKAGDTSKLETKKAVTPKEKLAQQAAEEAAKAASKPILIDDASAVRNGAADTSVIQVKAKKEKKEVPDWFKSAQSKANKKRSESDKNQDFSAQRSRYSHVDDVIAQKRKAEEEKKNKAEEEKRAKLREQIVAAKAAAEEERKKNFEEDKPFFRSEGDADSTTSMKPIENKPEDKKDSSKDGENEDLSLDERLRLRQMKDKKVGFAPKPENEEDDQSTVAMPAVNDNQPKEESLKPEDSGQIDLGKLKQYAPLDDQSFISSNDMPENSSLKELPDVYVDDDLEKDEPKEDSNSKSGANDKVEDGPEDGKFGTGSFAAISDTEGVAGATGRFSPVTDELIEDASKSGKIDKKEDMVINDADDSVYNEGQFTDAGAFAGKGYVEMPDEKRKGIFGIFGGKKKKEKEEKQSSGKHSGKKSKHSKKSKDNIIDTSGWEGGSFAGLGDKLNFKDKFAVVGKHNATEEDYVEQDYQEDNYIEDDYQDTFTEEPINNSMEDAPITSGTGRRVQSMLNAVPDFEEQIQEFHNSSINMEVWMVALGSEIDENAGINRFLMEHAQELRGAIIIDIEGLARGELAMVDTEGFLRKSETSSRLKRYVRQAANQLGVSVPTIDLPWSQSSARYANRAGYKTLHFCGVENGVPAGKMMEDDTVEYLDENKLKSNVKFLLELIQCI